MRALALALAIIIVSVPAPALGQSKTGTTIGQFLLIEPGARIAAMGNAGAAVAEGIQSVYYNPAALGLLDRWELQFTHSEWLAGIDYDYAALAVPVTGLGTFFGSVTSLNSGEIDVRTVDQPLGTGERYDVGNLALGVGYGRRITDRFSAGVRVNYIEERIWHSTLNTWTVDVGTFYRISESGLGIGSSLSNYGTRAGYGGRDLRIQYDGDPNIYGDNSSLPAEQFTDQFPVPLLFRVGLSYPRRTGGDGRLLLVVDAFHPNDNTEYVGAGAEWEWKETVALRSGYQDLFKEDSEVGLTLGLGVRGVIDEYHFCFDYGWADYGRLLDTHRVTFGMAF
ncbi:MAG: PorV/PorQ family protein [Candidatus Eisenbacteria bacterium]